MTDLRNLPRQKRRYGFTLIEVMIALVILTIGVLGLGGFLLSTVQSNRGATNHSRADQLLHDKVEELQSTPYAAIATGSDAVTVEGVPFTREWTVSPNDPVVGVMTIDLTASWSERGDTLSVVTSTMRANN